MNVNFNKKIMDKRLITLNYPNYTRCSVCHSIFVNQIGSTPCCGGINEGLYEDEVESLYIDVNKTRNKGSVRPFVVDILELEKERVEWSLITFTQATSKGSLEKAKEEIKEIEYDISKGIKNPTEYADVIMCIFDAAARFGISAEEVMKAYKEKMKINTERTWVKNPDDSYSHVKP